MGSAAADAAATALAYSCQVCGKLCGNSFPCSACSALYYCSSKHLRLRQRLGHDAAQCSRMRQQLARSQAAVEVCSWMQQLRCHAAGLLQHCCPVHTFAALATQHCDGARPDVLCFSPAAQQQQQSSPESAQHRCLSEACCLCNSSSSSTELPSLPSTQQEWEAAWAPLNLALLPAWGDVQLQVDLSQAQHEQPQQLGRERLPKHQRQQQQQGAEHPQELQGSQLQLQQQDWQPQQLPGSWSEYYQFRQIPVQSPAALALHFPLTLWYCLAQLLPAHGWPLPAPGQRISIAYLGPQSEVLLLPAFAELAALLPQHQLDIHMIGPDVPQQLHAMASTAANTHGGGLTVSCWAGCYHDVVQDWAHASSAAPPAAKEAPFQLAQGHARTPEIEAAAALTNAQRTASMQQQQGGWGPAEPRSGPLHLVFAANAGLPAFPAWLPTLQDLLRLSKHARSAQGAQQAACGTAAALAGACSGSTCYSKPVPVLFSDYCEEAAFKSQQMVQELLGCGFDLPCLLNPFRQPMGLSSHGTRLPACSNGFLFGWL